MMKLVSVSFASGANANAPLTLNAEPVQVQLPFPTTGTIRSIAAYVRSTATTALAIVLDVELQVTGTPPQQVWIGARRTRGSIAGDVTPLAVNAGDWKAGRATVRVKIPRHGLSTSAVGCYDLVWAWFSGDDPAQLTVPIGVSQHLVYLTLRPPLPPWTPGPVVPPARTSWVDAVHWACMLARGATTETHALGSLVTGLLTLAQYSPTGVRLKYQGLCTYTFEGATPAVFLARMFFRDIGGRNPKTTLVRINCADAATILNVLAAVLGCQLDLTVITRTDGFDINETLLIGSSLHLDFFDYHEVNLTAGGAGKRVYDCCLQLDSDEDPASGPSVWIPVGGLPLANGTGASPRSGYLSLLVANSDIKGCRLSSPMTRWIETAPMQTAFEPVRGALYRQYVERLESLPVGSQHVNIGVDIAAASTGFVVIGTETISPLVPRDPDLPQRPVYQELQLKSLAADDVELQVDVLPAATRKEAIALLAEWLVEIGIRLEEGELGIGEYAYRLPDRTLILFLSGLWACRVVSTGATDIDVSPQAVSLAALMRPQSS